MDRCPSLECMQREYIPPKVLYLLTERMILAEIWRKKMEPMNDNERIRTTNGSLR
jgi:hypothetical protein